MSHFGTNTYPTTRPLQVKISPAPQARNFWDPGRTGIATCDIYRLFEARFSCRSSSQKNPWFEPGLYGAAAPNWVMLVILSTVEDFRDTYHFGHGKSPDFLLHVPSLHFFDVKLSNSSS